MSTAIDRGRLHPVVEQMLDAVLAVLQSSAFRDAQGDDLERALQLVIAVCDEIHMPNNIYVPSGAAVRKSLSRHKRNDRIAAEYGRKNLEELAFKYKLSPRHIRRIAKNSIGRIRHKSND